MRFLKTQLYPYKIDIDLIVPKRRFPNRMDLFLYGTSDVNAVDRNDILGM